MNKWEIAGVGAMLVLSVAVLIVAIFILGSAMGRFFVSGTVELSMLQFGVICGGVTAIATFVRCVKRLKRRFALART
ncbi:hypothetical protein HMF8227_00197 [Saliniradius amylolyticus]|uniref:Uncharacterized protein n=1 Tax=Saliniradius amylolyticus TaxID=2183582 RepID=A0A2S2DZ66_9ALTE|nr:hypothetical protein [Saliniradius amylolyticus]AWL10705.1 hypothetical protein HMF8227_00197 [Saliniradius amylolyticus]